MLTLMEMLAQGADGTMIDRIARQYRLSHEQTQAAIEALMPAFSQGLKRNAGDPMGVVAFLQALSGGRHAAYYDDPDRAFGAPGRQEGNAILGHLFGSREVSRAVADQAAQMTGLSQAVLKAMLPALAPIILGGLFRQMSGAAEAGVPGAPADNPPGPLGPLGDLFGQMMGGTAARKANPWGRTIEEMTGGSPSRRRAPEAGAADPLGRMLQEMIRGGPASPPERGRDDTRRPAPHGYDELFGEMFETGRKVQKGYQDSLESIFDQFLGSRRG
ncbi:MAG: hypothetical protein BroJett030_13010 [Alphaproteobacteria bacterium]|nr:MAG: hypothetical protein BroJett030_13010 [Alphaproteobacteria bacterium]